MLGRFTRFVALFIGCLLLILRLLLGRFFLRRRWDLRRAWRQNQRCRTLKILWTDSFRTPQGSGGTRNLEREQRRSE